MSNRWIITLVVAALVLALTGCANLKFQWAASYQTENLIEDLKKARHEQIPDPVRP